MINYEFINKILGNFEGKALRTGYIPCEKGTWYPTGPDKGEVLGVSGVSIATGVDLGQQTEKSLISSGISIDLLSKLRSYLGKQKNDAKKALLAEPLTLTEEEVKELDECIHKKYIVETNDLFGKEFGNTPKEVQAVAVSLHYQFGTPFRNVSPALNGSWKLMQEGKYKEAANLLENPAGWSNSHLAYLNRRKQEAALLRKA
jgi:GH24 family phage-related lysozyme (muramidase)